MPLPTTAVVHLRLGDVSDAGDGDTNWEQGGQWHSPEGYQYVKGRAYYEEVVKRLDEMRHRPTVSIGSSRGHGVQLPLTMAAKIFRCLLKQVELVGSMFHHSSQTTHRGSVAYKNHVDEFFRSHGKFKGPRIPNNISSFQPTAPSSCMSLRRGAGFNVTHRWNHTPDEDLVYMSHAQAFVYSGGGFSRIVGECVHRLGGTTPISFEESLESGRTKDMTGNS